MVAPIARCWDVTETHVQDAVASRHAMTALLQNMVAVTRPNEGAAKILIVLARMAVDCEWLEGSLRVEIEGTGETSRLAVLVDLGGGVRERVFPRFNLNVPLAEFERGLRLAPRAIQPLMSRTIDGKIVLTRVQGGSQRPPSFELAEDCLQKSLPPKVRKSVTMAAVVAPPQKAQTPPAKAPGMSFEIPRAPKMLDLSALTPGPRPQIRRLAPPVPGKASPERGSKPPKGG